MTHILFVLAQCDIVYEWDKNAVHGLIRSGPDSSNPPLYWYFGDFDDDDYELCADECLHQNGCNAFALHLSGTGSRWRHQCYGRGSQTTMVEESNMVSGVKTCVP